MYICILSRSWKLWIPYDTPNIVYFIEGDMLNEENEYDCKL